MTAPGWYDDGHGQQRFYDGQQWTTAAVPLGSMPPQPTAPPQQQPGRITIHYGFALLAVFALLGTLFPVIVFIAGEDGTGYGVTFAILWGMWGGMWTLIWTAFAVHHTLRSR